ncbi:cytochrome P450 [Actinophytocola sp.]|uniref:cytochrome P450 n=1 Tax=Actinophytocola sp. TaxID=1872138 RepID=UPI002ED27213
MREPYRYSFEQPHRLEPTPLYAKLREDEPIARVQVPYGREAWLVTRHDTVKKVFTDTRLSRALAVGPGTPRRGRGWARAEALVSLDPPAHTRVRRLLATAFSMPNIRRLRPEAERIVAGLVDELVEHGSPVDLVQLFTRRAPVMVICTVLGIPYDDRGRFGQFPQLIMSTDSGAAREGMLAYLRDLIVERREQPTDDLFSALVREADSGGQITEDELVALGENLLANGYETMSNEIANFVYVLLTNPDHLAWLREDLSRLPTAIEELLRYVPLAAGAPGAGGHARISTEEIELDGKTFPAGDAFLPSVNSANRDDHVFAEPERLDLARTPNPHLTFGHGPHHCLGAQLARMEFLVILTELLTRFPTLRLAVPPDEVPWKNSHIQRGPARLLVAW